MKKKFKKWLSELCIKYICKHSERNYCKPKLGLFVDIAGRKYIVTQIEETYAQEVTLKAVEIIDYFKESRINTKSFKTYLEEQTYNKN